MSVENINPYFQIYIFPLFVIIKRDFCLQKDNRQCSTQRSGASFIFLLSEYCRFLKMLAVLAARCYKWWWLVIFDLLMTLTRQRAETIQLRASLRSFAIHRFHIWKRLVHVISVHTFILWIKCTHIRDIGKARQGKFICIAHFIHIGNSKCFT